MPVNSQTLIAPSSCRRADRVGSQGEVGSEEEGPVMDRDQGLADEHQRRGVRAPGSGVPGWCPPRPRSS